MTPPPISILILTKNEERDLPAALASVAGLNGSQPDDIHVFDSESTDRTHQIALAAGAHITTRPFDNWAAHQNWGLANIPFRYPWVLYIDADEVVTPELRASAVAAVSQPADRVAFTVQRRDFFEDTWLKHVQTSPFYMRLFRPEKMRYERLVNPLSIPDGPVGQLTGFLDHFPFSKGVGYWLDRHNKYATFEAQQILANRRAHTAAGGAPFSLKSAFLERDFHKKRYHQKELFYRLPARPFFKFLILYIAKRGFLDGRAGLRYSILQSIYEYMIVLKTDELARAATAPPPHPPPSSTSV